MIKEIQLITSQSQLSIVTSLPVCVAWINQLKKIKCPKYNLSENEQLHTHHCDENYLKWNKPYLGKIYLPCTSMFLVWPMSHLLTWRGQGLWPMTSATRQQKRCFSFTFESCHVINLYIHVITERNRHLINWEPICCIDKQYPLSDSE